MDYIKEQKKLADLNSTIKMAKKSQLYAKKLNNIDQLTSLNELSSLPFTTKSDLRDFYPMGGLCVDPSKIIEMHTTSGTTGKPTLSFYTQKDLDFGSAAISKAWASFGLNESSRVQFIMGYGLFSGAMLNTYALQKIGVFVLPAGIQPTAKQVELMIDFEIDTLVATPGFLLYLYEYLKENNIPRNSLKIKRAIAAGEVYSDEVRKQIENKLEIKVFDHYGLCEVNTGIAHECEYKNGLHILDDYVIAEIINPETGELMSDGEKGELVLTSLQKEASPIIRYRTGDISFMDKTKCTCGNENPRIGRITARVDDLLFIKGVKINPHELRELILGSFKEFIYGGDMKIKIKKNSVRFTPKIYLTLKKVEEELIIKIKEKIKDKTGLLFDVEHVEISFFNREGNTKVKLIEYV
jgi:phenylacetate-CoA ligase